MTATTQFKKIQAIKAKKKDLSKAGWIVFVSWYFKKNSQAPLHSLFFQRTRSSKI